MQKCPHCGGEHFGQRFDDCPFIKKAAIWVRGCLVGDPATAFDELLRRGEISVRLYNGLRNSGVQSLEAAAARGERAYRKQKNFGKHTVDELRSLLTSAGLQLK